MGKVSSLQLRQLANEILINNPSVNSRRMQDLNALFDVVYPGRGYSPVFSRPTWATNGGLICSTKCFLALVPRNVLVSTNLPPPWFQGARLESLLRGVIMRPNFGFALVTLLLLIPFAAKADDVKVFVGYTDNLRPSGFFPSPFCGDAGVTVCQAGPLVPGALDAGAIRIQDTSGAPITISNLTVTLNPGTGQKCSHFGLMRPSSPARTPSLGRRRRSTLIPATLDSWVPLVLTPATRGRLKSRCAQFCPGNGVYR